MLFEILSVMAFSPSVTGASNRKQSVKKSVKERASAR